MGERDDGGDDGCDCIVCRLAELDPPTNFDHLDWCEPRRRWVAVAGPTTDQIEAADLDIDAPPGVITRPALVPPQGQSHDSASTSRANAHNDTESTP